MGRWIALLAAALLVGGCASGSRPGAAGTSNSNVVDGITIPPPYVPTPIPVIPAPKTCPASFATTLSAAAGHAHFALKQQSSANLLTCTYRASAAPAGSCTGSKILVNTSSQAFWTFQRWTVETGQNSMWGHNPALNPRVIPGIGVEAEWAPAVRTFETATMNTWVTIFLTCPGRGAAVLDLAKQLAREGLATTA